MPESIGRGKDIERREPRITDQDRTTFRVIHRVLVACGIVVAAAGVPTFVATGTAWSMVSIVSGVGISVCALLLLRRSRRETS
jgi:hypothetical protein